MKNPYLTLADAQGREAQSTPLDKPYRLLKPYRLQKAARYAWLIGSWLVFSLLCLPQAAQGQQAAYTLTADDVQMSGGTITRYLNTTEKNIIIPATIGSVRVTAIGGHSPRSSLVGAFQQNNLTSVTIPDGVTLIGSNAFQHNDLTSVIIPGSVNSIGYYASRSNALTSVTILDGVTSIGRGAFNNNAITEFNGSASDGIIYARNPDGTEDVTAIASYGGASKVVNFIPDGVTTIGSEAFGSSRLTSVTIPASVTEIGTGAFRGNDLTRVTIEAPSRLKIMGPWAFKDNNRALTSVTLPVSAYENALRWEDRYRTSTVSGAITDLDKGYVLALLFAASDLTLNGGTITGYTGTARDIIIPETVGDVAITGIGNGAFNSNDLTSVTIPGSVTEIGGGAFYGNDLTSVTIPKGVTKIRASVFHANALTTVTMIGNVTEIEDHAFSHNRLTSVTIPRTVTDIGGGAFNRNAIAQINNEPSRGIIYARNAEGSENRSVIVSYGGTANVIDFIPDGVTSIGEWAFNRNDLTTVTIPNSVTTIGNEAFNDTDLTTVTFAPNSRLKAIGAGAFSENTDLTPVTLPTSAYENASQWEDGNGNRFNPSDVINDYFDEAYTLRSDDGQPLRLPDVTPPAVDAGQTFSYAEGQQNADDAISTTPVQAADNVEVTGFRIATGNNDNYFAIDNSGNIALTQAGLSSLANDFEAQPNRFILGIVATDAAGNSSTAVDVALNVEDVDEAPTFTASGPFNYAEDGDRTTADAIATVTAADPESGNLQYSITSGNTDRFFEMDDSSGEIALTQAGLTGAANDFEAEPNRFTITIRASDAAGNNAETDVALNVTDVDDEAPVFTASGPFSYPENQAAGVIAGAIVQARDNVAVTGYQITATNPSSANGFFSIDAGTGQISLTAAGAADASATDYETQPNRFTITVQASDAAGNNAETDVVLNVTDENDNAPVFTASGPFSYDENRTAQDNEVGTLTATDADAGANITFAIQSGNDASFFELNGQTGAITLSATGLASAANDFEAEPNQFILMVTASDGTLTSVPP